MSEQDYTLARDWRKLGAEGLERLFAYVPVESWVYPHIDGASVALPTAALDPEAQQSLNAFLREEGFQTIPFDAPWYAHWAALRPQAGEQVTALLAKTGISHEAQIALAQEYDESLLRSAAATPEAELQQGALERHHAATVEQAVEQMLQDPVKVAWLEYRYASQIDPHYQPDRAQPHYHALADKKAGASIAGETDNPLVAQFMQEHAALYPQAKDYFREQYGKPFVEPDYYFVNEPNDKFAMQAYSEIPLIVVNLAVLDAASIATVLPHEFSHLAHKDVFSAKHHADLAAFTMEAELRCDHDAAHIQGSVLPRITDLLQHAVAVRDLTQMPEPVTPETVTDAIDALRMRYKYMDRASEGYPFPHERLQDLVAHWDEIERAGPTKPSSSMIDMSDEKPQHRGKVTPDGPSKGPENLRG